MVSCIIVEKKKKIENATKNTVFKEKGSRPDSCGNTVSRQAKFSNLFGSCLVSFGSKNLENLKKTNRRTCVVIVCPGNAWKFRRQKVWLDN